ncbi:MAG: transglutaminase family protein, partial [Myxococcales bacterium]|nr:transglutaminase family protein [Myxococcales bacterium]
HIPLACTVNPELAAPVTGTAEQGAEDFSHHMEVIRLGHEPRPRMPYTDEQWEQLTATGRSVDEALRDRGVTLTTGGEPTFTSRLHPKLPEWNTEALGETKWEQGLAMAQELHRRFGVGGLVQYRMGKQYPGESLPRWALHLMWRRDGIPIWKDPGRLSFEAGSKERIADEHLARAARLLALIGSELGLQMTPAAGYEDPWHFIQQEENLPLDVDPLEADLDDPEERRRLARVLGHGLKREIGFAAPLARYEGAWRTGSWTFRRGHLFLIPGDSPMGLRLPLDRIGGEPPPIVDPDRTEVTRELRFEPRPLLREAMEGERQLGVAQRVGDPRTGIRTALCVEPRQNVMHVFLPPVPTAEDFLELVRAVELAATECDVRVRIEGYPPPSDPRIESCLVTPDPGVIEVNLPVATSFADYTSFMETITDAANHAGLSMEKYQLDGREAGSGGGNHITLGGPSALESPFLQRPQLLGSLLRYLQNHPSLSFLFTGLFVGPTSQAPRIDEARLDSLPELELALEQMPLSATKFPWTVDRLLRNLLVDVSGNPHRTEVSI